MVFQRRRFLQTVVGVSTIGLAGCSFTLSGSQTPSGPDSQPETLFFDEFDDGSFSDVWEYPPENGPDDDTIGEGGGTLMHMSDTSYNNGATLHTIEEFQSEGTRTIEAQLKSNSTDYWGYGFGVSFGEGMLSLREDKWEGYDRFGVSGVEDHPSEYDSDYDDNYAKYDDTHFARVQPATTSTEYIKYSVTLDFDDRTIVSISRGNDAFELDLDM